MNTKDVIELLKRLDPDGDKQVIVYDETDNYVFGIEDIYQAASGEPMITLCDIGEVDDLGGVG